LQDTLPAGGYGRLLLMPGTAPKDAVVPESLQVSNCFNAN